MTMLLANGHAGGSGVTRDMDCDADNGADTGKCTEGYSDEEDGDELPVKRSRTILIPDPVTPLPAATQKLTAMQKKKAKQERVATKAAEKLAKQKVKLSKVAEKAAKAAQLLAKMQEKDREKEEARAAKKQARPSKVKAKTEAKPKGKRRGKEENALRAGGNPATVNDPSGASTTGVVERAPKDNAVGVDEGEEGRGRGRRLLQLGPR